MSQYPKSIWFPIFTHPRRKKKKKGKTVYVYSQLKRSQGVEFTEISWGRWELCASEWEETTSLCNGLRAYVSCAKEGRKLGSLKKKKKGHGGTFIKESGGLDCLNFQKAGHVHVSQIRLPLPTLQYYTCNQWIYFFWDVQPSVLEANSTYHLHRVHPTPWHSQCCKLPKNDTKAINITPVKSSCIKHQMYILS